MIRAPQLALAATLLALLATPVAARKPDGIDPFWKSSGSWGQAHRDQWGLARIGWTPELARSANTPVVVAVIDTGLDYYHADLPPKAVFANGREFLNGRDDDDDGYADDLLGWNFVDDNGNPWDNAGHGTHVAGIIAAATGNDAGIAGMHPRAVILPLKVLNFIGQGRPSRVAEAIYHAVGKGARVINLSLGGDAPSKAATHAVEYAGSRGVLVVVAAGNNGREIGRTTLTALPNVIVVGATGPEDKRASFSNYGAIDLVAPGVDILSLRARRTDVALIAGLESYRPGQNFVGPKARYYRVSGTSFAAPFVSGVAALIWSMKPELDAVAVKRMIVQSARDIGTPGVDQDTAYGLLDAKAALAADPEYFVDASIADVSVESKSGGLFVRVRGSVGASRFARAWIEVGKGADPDKWRRVSRTIQTPIGNDVLDDLPASAFDGPGIWTLRLIAEHHDGRRREARRSLQLD